MSTIRTRFAPSPTGFFHIGSARTALFNWLFARHTGGKFILRVEDTDKERNNDQYLQVIYDSLKWLGMDWDEGPGIGGNYGPYKQSERADVYQDYLKKLTATGRTYEKDGAIWFRLEGERYTEYDSFLKKEVEKVKAAPVTINDLIRGKVERAEDRDFVIVRNNGEPVFHFVNVVDDIAMEMTHVIRGEDHLSNTSKHVELYNALGAPVPAFAHIPLILKTDGPGKMSKRDRGALIEEYQSRHFLPAAVRNYLCLLGWTPKDGREVLPIGDIIDQFELSDVHQANARFDEKKMAFINQQHLRALPLETFAWLATPVLQQAGLVSDTTNENYLQSVLALCQEKLPGLENLADISRYFFTDDFPYDEEARAKISKKSDPAIRIRQLIPALEKLQKLDDADIDAAINDTASANGAKPGDYFAPLRFAISGVGGGPHLHDVVRVLGKDRVIARAKKFTGE
ncbi:MAG: glutamate--tRNA ligase [Puniceicoccales bacterium]|jgi:glutamyl-tRNA synthetase|nr:glutamate--tRNA ligase [Puniceicoccales bacterium]